jgi:hypothetical protein
LSSFWDLNILVHIMHLARVADVIEAFEGTKPTAKDGISTTLQ